MGASSDPYPAIVRVRIRDIVRRVDVPLPALVMVAVCRIGWARGRWMTWTWIATRWMPICDGAQLWIHPSGMRS